MKFVPLLFLFLDAAIGSNAQINSKPFVLGVIDVLPSAILHEKRTLNIYLPEGYNQQDTTQYPVVYLLDGSADEDFIHVAGLYQFNNFSWVDRVPKSIVVGIANIDRKRDFTFPTNNEADKKRYPTSGGSEKFMAFIEKELQPFMGKKYNANSCKTIIGQSLGGLFATEVLLKKPQLFSQYIIISPSIWWNDGSLLQQSSPLVQAGYAAPTSIYIGVGKEGLAPSDVPHVMEVDANLMAEKIQAGKNKQVRVYLDYMPDENHATITHQAVFNALRWLHPIKE